MCVCQLYGRTLRCPDRLVLSDRNSQSEPAAIYFHQRLLRPSANWSSEDMAALTVSTQGSKQNE